MTTTNSTAGIKTTYPYEATSPGVARHQCEECGLWERSDKNFGRIPHSRRCESRPQVVAQPAPATVPATGEHLREVAASVKRSAMTKGNDRDVYEAVRAGYLRETDAMNSDD